jgi:nitrogenase molybdenum-iron protein alpha chain
METIAAGYEFAHRDDYEGRSVLPSIKVDADSRNIEELNVQPDPDKFRPEAQNQAEGRAATGYRFREYDGMMADMKEKTLIVDDINHWESERLIELVKPDIFCAGIKEKYVIQKMGVPCKQLHSYDYGGPYAAFQGAINFYAEVDRMVNTKVWSHLRAPWEDERSADTEPSPPSATLSRLDTD